jgi:hypothetical protein
MTFSAQAGDEIGNGGGQAENVLMMAYYQLPMAIDLGLKNKTLDQKVKDLLIKIKEELNTQYSFDLIQFDSGEAKPFVGQDNPRLAVTLPYPGAPITFNLDLLYNQKSQTITLNQGISILIHEFGHHHGQADHLYLDYIGGIVASEASHSTSVYPLNLEPESNTVILTTHQANSFDVLGLILISNKQVYDLKKEISQSINCDEFKILNIHWNKMGLLEAQIYYNGLEKLIQITQDGQINFTFF